MSLIDALQSPAAFDHPVDRFQVHETHISWVLCTGRFAYKIKKPVDLGFADFSTLERRRFFCEEELRLNRRLAPELYLGVEPIVGSAEGPRVGGAGVRAGETAEVIEWAVKMRQFGDRDRLDHVLERGELGAAHIDALAVRVASFHREIAVAGPDSPWGEPTTIAEVVGNNFTAIRRCAELLALEARAIESLEGWSRASQSTLVEVFRERKRAGQVRECHGDLHLANMALVDSRVTLFDGIEFSEPLRWIDTASEIAFLIMDLQARGRAGLAFRFLSAYLDACGDHDLLRALRHYLVYRALVRAKVACIRLGQGLAVEEERRQLLAEARRYVGLAEGFTRPDAPALWITHGVSGSGKSMTSQALLEAAGAVRLRSDVERKRLLGLPPLARSDDQTKAQLYRREMTERTFAALEAKAETILRAGWRVIVDATFLKRALRRRFRAIAERAGVPFAILDVQASREVLAARVGERERSGEDASEADLAVLRDQLANAEPLDAEERRRAVTIDSTLAPSGEEMLRRILEVRSP